MYTRYEDDLVNYPYIKPTPNKYFKVTNVDMDWGTVSYNVSIKYFSYESNWENTIGIAYVRKTNWIEKIKWFLYWR